MTVWKKIEECPYYEVSDMGDVRSIERSISLKCGQVRKYKGREIKGRSYNQYGHPKVHIRDKNGNAVLRYIHNLVAETFIGERPEGMETAHNDGDPSNNRLDNIRYCSAKENNADKLLHGTHMKGNTHPKRILSQEDVDYIRNCLRKGENQNNLAKQFGVARTTISAIATERSWKK